MVETVQSQADQSVRLHSEEEREGIMLEVHLVQVREAVEVVHQHIPLR
jgi:hypothetical protein